MYCYICRLWQSYLYEYIMIPFSWSAFYPAAQPVADISAAQHADISIVYRYAP
eukprot:COSAG01_NODE_59457_length_300_cov_0.766169_1_plen_52_part_10